MQRMRPPFQDHRDSNQGPLHQYPPAEFEMHSNQDEYKMMNTPVSGKLLITLTELINAFVYYYKLLIYSEVLRVVDF